jgi:hypothetical protein
MRTHRAPTTLGANRGPLLIAARSMNEWDRASIVSARVGTARRRRGRREGRGSENEDD